MRLSLIDQLIAIVVVVCGVFAGVWLAQIVGHHDWRKGLSALFAVVFYFVFTPLIYRKFRFRPLLFPRCPHCKDANRHYQFLGIDWRRDLLKCGTCQSILEVWYDAPEEEEVSRELASFQLLWPQSWGRWRVLNLRKTAFRAQLPEHDKLADGALESRG